MPTSESYLGPIRWSRRWRIGSQANAIVLAVVFGLMAVPLVLFLAASVSDPSALAALCLAAFVVVGAPLYWLIRPTTYTAYIGEYGVLRTCVHGFKITREELMFKDAARVEQTIQRMIANAGERPLYSYTNVTVTWYDDGGAPIFQLSGRVREPSQREEWTVTDDLDPAATENLSPMTPEGFAFAAKRAFEDYATTGGPYRAVAR